MTVDEAEKYADEMTYREAIENALSAKCVPYRRATLTKLHRLLKKFGENVDVLDKISAEIREEYDPTTEDSRSINDIYDSFHKGLRFCLDIIEKYKKGELT